MWRRVRRCGLGEPTQRCRRLGLFQPFNAFAWTGSHLTGLQSGYDYMLPYRVLVGAVADISFLVIGNEPGADGVVLRSVVSRPMAEVMPG